MPEYGNMYVSATQQTASSEESATPEAIKDAASNLARNVLTFIHAAGEAGELSDEAGIQSLMAKFQVAQIAMNLPLASIGSCHCGNNLRYKGTSGGLLVCCTGDPEHCWTIG